MMEYQKLGLKENESIILINKAMERAQKLRVETLILENINQI